MDNRSIYITQIVASFTRYLFVPYFAIWLFDEKLLSVAKAAAVVTATIITLRIAALFLTPWINLVHKKYTVISGAAALIVIYLGMYFLKDLRVDSFIIWLIAALILGTAISCANVALNSLIAINLKPSDHVSGFSYLNVALNVGAGVGPLLSAFIMDYNQNLLPLIPIIFSLALLVMAFYLPNDAVLDKHLGEEHKLISLFKNEPNYIFLLILTFLTFIGFAQFYDVFPIYAKQFVSVKWIGWLFFLSSVVIVLLQVPAKNLMLKISNKATLIIANLLFALGILGLLTIHFESWAIIIIAVILISTAELLFIPTYQTLAVKLHPGKPVAALAQLFFIIGASEAFATLIGLNLVGYQTGAYSFWFGIFMTALVSILLLVRSID